MSTVCMCWQTVGIYHRLCGKIDEKQSLSIKLECLKTSTSTGVAKPTLLSHYYFPNISSVTNLSEL